MFQYTSEVIINSNEGNLVVWDATASTPAEVSGLRFAGVKIDSSKTPSISKVASGATHLIVDGVNLLAKDNITAVYKNAYVPPVNEIAVISVPNGTAVSAGDVLRLKVVAAEEGLTSPIYLDAQLKHKKPFFYEIKVGSTKTPAVIAGQFKDVIADEMRMTDFDFFTASVDASGNLVLTADNCYTRFQEISIVKVNNGADVNATGYQDFEATSVAWERKDGSANGVTLTKGNEGAGTVARLIKNLRVPTDANTDPFAADNGGRPVPGGHYNQYTIEYTTDRRHIGGQVVGAVDKSITTHVFFIESAAVTDWEAALTAISKSPTSAKANVSGSPAALTVKDPKVGSKQ